MPQIIHELMSIDEVLSLIPQAESVLSEYELGCSGCSASSFETLGDGIRSHGYEEETVQAVIRDLNHLFSSYSENIEKYGIYVTPRALDQLDFFADELDKPDHGISIQKRTDDDTAESVYKMDFQKEAKDNEKTVYYQDQMEFYFPDDSFEDYQGLMIDFVENIQGSGFKLTKNSGVKE